MKRKTLALTAIALFTVIGFVAVAFENHSQAGNNTNVLNTINFYKMVQRDTETQLQLIPDHYGVLRECTRTRSRWVCIGTGKLICEPTNWSQWSDWNCAQ
ncbi:MAG: hypothetical protein EHM93_19685 [Bacteroidales bacterium]|nr:MAG: hypothetical protein EHM93_19685 [Bacteroidales bacterium]